MSHAIKSRWVNKFMRNSFMSFGGDLALSGVRWSFTRRTCLRILLRFVRPKKVQWPNFVPVFEIAVFLGPPPFTTKPPVVIFFYKTEAAATAGWERLSRLLERDGSFGFLEMLRTSPCERSDDEYLHLTTSFLVTKFFK